MTDDADALDPQKWRAAILRVVEEAEQLLDFRAAENIIRSFEAELSFYGQVFGFSPADPIEPIEVAFLEPATGSAATA